MNSRPQARFIRQTVVVVFCVVGQSGSGFALGQSEASFQGLGVSISSVTAVSADGSVVVGVGAGTQAFRWTQATGGVGLGDLPGGNFRSHAHGVSANGLVVVGNSSSANSPINGEAFRWTQATGMVALGDLPGDIFISSAFGVSADGSEVVGFGHTITPVHRGRTAFRWTQATGMVTLDGLDFPSVAYGITGDGSVVVGDWSATLGQEAFRWTQGTGPVGLGQLPGDDISIAFGVSADGLAVVGFSLSVILRRVEAFRWTQATGLVGLVDLPGGSFESVALGVSGDGLVVVGSANSALGQEAFIWDPVNAMRNLRDVLVSNLGLDLTGWTLSEARGVSEDGRVVVGNGTNPNGDSEAWMAILPECTSDADCPCPPDPLEACPNPWAPDPEGGKLSRTGCFRMPASAVAAGEETAIRVKLVDLYIDSIEDPVNGCPVRSEGNDLSAFENQVRYLGPPSAFDDNDIATTPKFIAAELQCTPFYRDWNPGALTADFGPGVDTDQIYYYGAEVFPCSLHEAQQATQACVESASENCFSTSLEIRTALWGDVWPPFGDVSFTDIGKVVEAFKGIPFVEGPPPDGAPRKVRAMLRENSAPFGSKINFTDIGNVVKAFKTIAYAEAGPTACP